MQRIAPGLVRLPIGKPASLKGGAPGGLPLTLTTKAPYEELPVGLLVPKGGTPWGCLFIIILAGSGLLTLYSQRLAILLGAAALIVYWGVYNHPSRRAAEKVHRALGMLGAGKAERASQVLEPALRRQPGDDGLHYLAAMAALSRDRAAQALTHLKEARPRMGAYAEYHHITGRCLRDLKRPEEAREAYEKALAYAAYPSRDLLLQEMQEFHESAGDAAAAARIRELRAEAVKPDSEAAQQAFRESLSGFKPKS